MKTSLKTRLAALAAACFVTFAVVNQIADYAYPEAAPVQLASSSR